MPRSMGHPDYKYTPWTPERRKAASEKTKAWWAAKRAREDAERMSAAGQLAQIRRTKTREMDEIANRWHRLKAEVEEIDKVLGLIAEIRPVLRKYAIGNSQSA